MSYTIEQARREVAAAILRAVEKDMNAEIRAGERLMREGKGTTAGGPYDAGLTPEQLPLAVQATREMLDELRRRAARKGKED